MSRQELPDLLIVDHYATRKSPSMRSVLESIGTYAPLFGRIELWSMESDFGPERVEFHPVRCHGRIWTLLAQEFRARVRCRFRRRDPAQRAREIVLSTGTLLPQSDIRYIHFWHGAYLEMQRRFGREVPFGLRDRLVSEFVRRDEVAATSRADRTHWWVVSRSLSERIAAEAAPDDRFRVLPNPYDPQRFQPAVRERARWRMREHYGLAESTTTFVFSAMGHFERKGLLGAVRMVQALAAGGRDVALLVLGGRPSRIAGFRRGLQRRGIDDGAVRYVGVVSPVEEHLAAADALLFPSYFEAFSLAEIEAAALGLRLYLTPHCGSEMILREGVNGRWLPWDPAGAVAVLAEEIDSGAVRQAHRELGEALSPPGYREALRAGFEACLRDRGWPVADSGRANA